jgi:hypothetical protein
VIANRDGLKLFKVSAVVEEKDVLVFEAPAPTCDPYVGFEGKERHFVQPAVVPILDISAILSASCDAVANVTEKVQVLELRSGNPCLRSRNPWEARSAIDDSVSTLYTRVFA